MTDPAGPVVLPPLDRTPWADLRFDRHLVDLWTALCRTADRWPDRTAWTFIDAGGELTYSELREQVASLAAGLARIGVTPGDHVGTLMTNVPAFPLTWLAVARLGAVIVPLNPGYTPREIDFIARSARLSRVVLEENVCSTFLQADSSIDQLPAKRRVLVGGSRDAAGHSFDDLLASGEPLSSRLAPPDPRSLHTIQFTSGTTGLPKGCMLTHAYWMMLGRVAAAMLGDPANILADHPFYYMQNQFYLAMALACGARMVVTRGLSRRRFMGWLRDYDIDMAWVGSDMLRFEPSSRDREHQLRLAPADELNPATHRDLEQRFGIIAREWYASTEIGTGTMVPFSADELVGSGSIGIPAPYRETLIVDETMRPVADGTVGELLVRGPHMMLGYHDRPDANAAAFVDGGWFRTGDLCHRDTNGLHYFDGRIKDMIRRSGENIAAQEVEAVLGQLPGVMEVAVIGIPDRDRGEQVKACIVTDPGAAITEDQVSIWCAQRLAPFKRPRYIELRSLPLPRTSSGKIAKATLRSETADSPAAAARQPASRDSKHA